MTWTLVIQILLMAVVIVPLVGVTTVEVIKAAKRRRP